VVVVELSAAVVDVAVLAVVMEATKAKRVVAEAASGVAEFTEDAADTVVADAAEVATNKDAPVNLKDKRRKEETTVAVVAVDVVAVDAEDADAVVLAAAQVPMSRARLEKVAAKVE